MGDGAAALARLPAALRQSGLRVVQLVPGAAARSLDGDRFEVDFSSRESLRTCHAALCAEGEARVGAVVNLLGLEALSSATDQLSVAPLPVALGLLHAVQEFFDDLRASSKEGGGWVLNVTSLDGRFGCGQRGEPLAFGQAGTLGLCKTLAREIPGARVKCVDLAPDLPPADQERRLFDEFFASDALSEVGHDREGRWTLRAEAAKARRDELGPLPLDRDSVVLITGGAAGVTAAAAKELARLASPRLILVGRSPLPAAESAAMSQHRDKTALRQHLLEEARRAGEQVKPAELEARLKRILKDREIRENLAALRAAGSQVDYRAVDVRDTEKFAALIDEVYRTYGRLDGVVHGAGLVEDKFLRDKTSDSFARVFSTKVDSALTLAKRLRPESLRFLVFFSSVSARLGSRGQVDYAAANEVLNKLAAHLGAAWPGRVVAINWGPWHGGMVSDELLRQYAARNIATIGLEAGARSFVEELRLARKSTPEILLVAGDPAVLFEAAAA